MKTNLRYLRWLLFAGLVAVLVYYCQKCGNTAAPTNYVGDKNGNTLNVRFEAPANTLNFYTATSAYPRYACAQVFQSLGITDPETFQLQPVLAKSIPTARMVTEGPYQGSLAYDFEILPEAVWDNGSPVTGNDLVFSFKIQLDPLLPLYNFGGYIADLQDIEVDAANPKKFTVYFKKYYILTLETLCQTPFFPAYHYDPQNLLADIPLRDLLDPEKAKTLAAGNANLIKFTADYLQPRYASDPAGISGSGPYRPESIGAEQTVLVRKTAWWGDKVSDQNRFLKAYPDRIVYKFVRDESVVENMLRSGDLDVALTISPTKYFEMKADSLLSANYDFETRWAPQYNRLLFNLTNPKLADKRVRQAIAQAFDYDYLMNTVQRGLAKRTVGPVHPNKPDYAQSITPYAYNIQRAKELLAEAGWTDTDGDGTADKMVNGQRVPFTLDVIATTTNKVTEQIGISLEQSARNAGIKINIIPADISEVSKRTRAGDFEAALMGLGQSTGLNDFYQNYHSKSLAPAGDNRARYQNAQLDQLIEQIRGTADKATRAPLYLQAQQIIHDDVPEIFIYAPDQRYIGSKRFKKVFSSERPGFHENLFELLNKPQTGS